MQPHRSTFVASLIALLLLTTIAAPQAALAEPDAEGIVGRLEFFAPPVQGTLGSDTVTEVYSFAAEAGQPVSLRAATSGGLALDLVLVGSSGDLLARGVPSLKTSDVMVIDAFILPYEGTYTVTLDALNGTTGSYELRLLGGYAELAVFDDFSTNTLDPLQLDWSPSVSLDVASDVVNGALEIQILNQGRLGYVEPDGAAVYRDLYVEADFTIDSAPGYYEYGFALRLEPGAEAFYALTFSSEGDWALFYFDGMWNVVQDWTASPAIDGSDRNPHVSVFVQGTTVRVFFNDQLVGEVTEPRPFSLEGGIALVAATSPDEQGILMAYVDNLAITTPATPGDAMAAVQ